MSFLDNLESNLKNLESASERNDPGAARRREADRDYARAASGHAEALRTSPFTNELLTHAVRIGHGMRVKVNMNWMGNALLLQARERKLELRPTPEGVVAIFSEDGEEKATEPIDLQGNAQELAERWLG